MSDILKYQVVGTKSHKVWKSLLVELESSVYLHQNQIWARSDWLSCMLELYDQIQEAVTAIRNQWDHTPHAGIILGTGLGGLIEQIEVQATLDYEDIPNFPRSTAISHRGRLVCGTLNGLPVMAMEGRFHMYEGYSLKQITLPVRVMKAMGAELLVVSNACGGMNPQHRCSDLIILHLNISQLLTDDICNMRQYLYPRLPI